MVVAVTGASGQLGQALRYITGNYPHVQFCFAASAEADITNKESLRNFFTTCRPDFCINAAAYTAVDKAESEQDNAYAVNVTGTKNLAEICAEYGTTLLHISTDFVFNGNSNTPYTEEDNTDPQGIYGQTKRDGELAVQNALKEYYIIRTSWVYSQFANNFMKTMLRLGQERDMLSVVNDQVGTPTNAIDLAEALMEIILSNKQQYGIYHYSNEGSCSWYDFAKKIFEIHEIKIDLQPIPTSAYPTPAQRPKYSVLDKAKIKKAFNLAIPDWESSITK